MVVAARVKDTGKSFMGFVLKFCESKQVVTREFFPRVWLSDSISNLLTFFAKLHKELENFKMTWVGEFLSSVTKKIFLIKKFEVQVNKII